MKKTIKILALITVTVVAVKALERVQKKENSINKVTIKITDLPEYKYYLEEIKNLVYQLSIVE